jgi:hypothetical protein
MQEGRGTEESAAIGDRVRRLRRPAKKGLDALLAYIRRVSNVVRVGVYAQKKVGAAKSAPKKALTCGHHICRFVSMVALLLHILFEFRGRNIVDNKHARRLEPPRVY